MRGVFEQVCDFVTPDSWPLKTKLKRMVASLGSFRGAVKRSDIRGRARARCPRPAVITANLARVKRDREKRPTRTARGRCGVRLQWAPRNQNFTRSPHSDLMHR